MGISQLNRKKARICIKCSHRDFCKSPCMPIQMDLKKLSPPCREILVSDLKIKIEQVPDRNYNAKNGERNENYNFCGQDIWFNEKLTAKQKILILYFLDRMDKKDIRYFIGTSTRYINKVIREALFKMGVPL